MVVEMPVQRLARERVRWRGLEGGGDRGPGWSAGTANSRHDVSDSGFSSRRAATPIFRFDIDALLRTALTSAGCFERSPRGGGDG